jgi:hypothetical protein
MPRPINVEPWIPHKRCIWQGSTCHLALTFVLALYTSLETVRGLAEAVPVHLCVDELEDGNEAVLALRILR